MIKFRLRSSIHAKVKIGFYICLYLILFVAVLSYFNLRTIEKKIAFSIVISEVFDFTLEMRRFEKNYILYGLQNDYDENLRFTNKAEEIIRKNEDAIKKLSIKTDVYALEVDILEYKYLMQNYSQINRNADLLYTYNLEGKIRTTGKRLVDAAEAISKAEHKYIQSLINSFERFLLVSIAFLIIASYFIGRYLSRVVVRPLKQLEDNMQRIADGKFDTISVNSSDKEIISLTNAVNRMLKEVEVRQMGFIAKSEKLASLGTMVSGVAHQLNNPLSNISSSCQILQEEVESIDKDYEKELLLQIEGEVERAKAMVHSLLEFSKKKGFKGEKLFLKDLIDDTLRLLKGAIPTAVEVSASIPETLWITADKQKIQQALLNIIKNSIDAIPDEGKVIISAVENPETKTVKVTIQDTGLGIEPENIEGIFEPFFTTKDKGTGLGLFVAREFIKEHGGVIEVKSNVGEGTTFTITLMQKES